MNPPSPIEKPHRPGFLASLRNNFLAGLVVIAPIGLTVWLFWTITGWVDSFVWPFVPNAYHPDILINRWFGNVDPTSPDHLNVDVRGIGVIVFLIFTILVGSIAKGVMGRTFISFGEGLVARMPVVRSVYNGAKQLAETVFAQSESSFDRACLVQYPRPGLWAIAFISTKAKGEIKAKVPEGEEILTVFVPTTPNPTSGFLLFLREDEVIELDMSVEDAAKLVISAGLVYPQAKNTEAKKLAKALEKEAAKKN